MPKKKPDTLHAATAKLLACWGRMHPGDRPIWLVNEIDNLGAAFNAYSLAQSARVNRDAVGRPASGLRPKVAKMLKAGSTAKEINAETAASAGLIQDVRDELRAVEATKKPAPINMDYSQI